MEKVEKIDSIDSMLMRYFKLILGLFSYAIGIVITINANLGYSPWDVFHQGLSNILHIKIGTANVLVGIIIITISIVNGQRPGIGTICNMFLIGFFMNLIMSLNIIPTFSNLYIRIISIFVGMFIMGLGSYFYIKAGFGAGPRDGLMLILYERTGKSIRLVRGSMEVTALIAGYILGGPVGIGTVILSLGIGYVIQLVFARFHFDPNTVDHRGWDDEMEFLKELMKKQIKDGFKMEVNLRVKAQFVNEYKAGYPLILRNRILNIDDVYKEGNIVRLVDEDDKFIARGYYGKQNKGSGWVLTQKEDEAIDIDLFRKKLIVALNKRTKFFNDPDTNCFRLFNGEGDGIGGLTIEYFDEFLVINWYSEGIYEFKDMILESLGQLTYFKGIYEKKRFNDKGKYIEEDDFVMGERAEFPLIVKENGVKFAVYLNDGAMVGVFLDQREVRKAIRDRYSRGRRVLNTFSYTGAFSVFASLGGAEKTTSVDLANRSLPKTEEQFTINDIDPKGEEIIVDNVFNYFKYALRKDIKFDLIILDPPSFAKSKNFRFSAEKDYKDLLKESILITEDGGTIVASTNCANFDMNKFKSFVSQAFKETGFKYKLLEEYSLPEDFKTIEEFKEGDYLKVLFIKKYS